MGKPGRGAFGRVGLLAVRVAGETGNSASAVTGVVRKLTVQTRTVRNRSALVITDTDDRLIASAAIIGLSCQPKSG
jgi:hypothetical protein